MTMIPREVLRVGDRIIMAGDLADRPQACLSAKGCLYVATDEDDGTIYRCDGTTWVQVTPGVSAAGGGITELTGDVAAGPGSGSQAATIANDAVTYAKLQNVSATDKVLGRSSSGAGDVEEIACTAAGRALLDDASASDQRTTLGLAIGTDVPALAVFNDHSARHENGGADEISVAGLSGELADPQPPKDHASEHAAGGGDALKLDDLGAPDDNTDLNVSTSAHGLTPKLPNDATKFLNGVGGYTVPSLSALSGIKVIRKASDETVTSSDVLQDDDDLLFTVLAGESWVFTIFLLVDGATGGDIKINVVKTSTGTLRWGGIGPSASTSFDTAAPEAQAADEIEMGGSSSVAMNYGTNGTTTPQVILIHGSIAATADQTLKLTWSQRVSGGTATTVRLGSYLMAFRTT